MPQTLTNTTPYRRTKKNWQDLQKEKVIQKCLEKKEKKKEQLEKMLKSPASSPDLQVAHALNKIFGTLLGEMTESKPKQE